MSDKTPLKSAYELAMERLRSRDREAGIEEPSPLTARQKKQIAALRRKAQARLAELEILHRDNLASETDPTKIAEIEEHYQTDRDRVRRTVETDVDAIKRG